jgi:predicted nucleic acid-binding protein
LIDNLRTVGFDTNALIYYLERREPYRTWLRPLAEEMRLGNCKFVFSTIVYAELRVRPLREGNDEALSRIEVLMASRYVDLVPVTKEIGRKGSEIRAELNLELPDALIVATAVHSGCDALIGNDKNCARRVTEIPYIYLDEAVKR